jgi:hypothetical protein
MQTRYRAAATALLLTATAGLAASGGAAQASGTHHATAKAAKSLTVTITSTKKGPKLSTRTIRPGFTTFKVVHKSGGSAGIEVLRLKSGYSLRHLLRDLPKVAGQTTVVKAVRRVDKNVVFYGGGDVAKPVPVAKFAVDIDRAGTYYVLNIFKCQVTALHAKGAHQRRSHPSADGQVNAALGNVFKVRGTLPHRGWMKTSNNALEPHFVEFDPILDSATDQDVADWFNNPSGPPPFDGTKPSFSTEVVSPGHTVYWKFSGTAGRHVITCFFPSKMDGTPHAFMGMFKVTTLS